MAPNFSVAKSAVVTGAPVTGGRDATCKAMAMKIEGTGFHLEDGLPGQT